MTTSIADPIRRDRLDMLAVWLLIGCCLLWGLQQIVVKATLPLMPPIAQAAFRSAFAAILVLAWARWRGIPLFAPDRTLAPGVIAGLLFGVEFAFIHVGLQHTTAARLVVLLYLAPFVVAAGMPFISAGERLSRTQTAGLIMGFLAVVLAFTDRGLWQGGLTGQIVGDGLAVLAAILWGATTLVIRASALATASAERTLFYQLAVSAPLLALLSPLSGESLSVAWTAELVGSLALQAVGVAFLSYLVWFWLIRHYPGTQLSAFTFLTPLFGLTFGWLLLAEPVSTSLLLALAGVAGGIWLVNRR